MLNFVFCVWYGLFFCIIFFVLFFFIILTIEIFLLGKKLKFDRNSQLEMYVLSLQVNALVASNGNIIRIFPRIRIYTI